MAEEIREVRETVPTTAGPGTMAARLIYLIFGIIIGFIVLRMIFLLLGANQGSAFVDFVYSVSGFFVAPFFGMFSYQPSYGVSVFEISSLVAIVVYALVCWALVRLVTLGSRRGTTV